MILKRVGLHDLHIGSNCSSLAFLAICPPPHQHRAPGAHIGNIAHIAHLVSKMTQKLADTLYVIPGRACPDVHPHIR